MYCPICISDSFLIAQPPKMKKITSVVREERIVLNVMYLKIFSHDKSE